MRTAEIRRKTTETDVSIKLNLDGEGKYHIDTGCGFLNHMLELFARHGRFDIEAHCKGDVDVDYHHTVEDTGIALGEAFKAALGQKQGINRYGHIVLPMDEALILAAVDISGRALLNYKVKLKATKLSDCGKKIPAVVGDFDTELVEEFLLGFVRNSDITLHVVELDGTNTHHILEGVFKAFGRALKAAVAIDSSLNGEVPSTKGVL